MNARIALSAIALCIAGNAAQAELVLVANSSAPISSLSASQVSRLFLGQTDLLPNGAKAVPLAVSGDTEDQFSREILKKSPEQVEKYWARMIFTGKAKPPREVKVGEVKAAVSGTPGAISYMERSQVDGSLKIIPISAN
ncbi:MAG TPA: hypothetical protein VFM34_01245 [Moraxellaceae bacterium]|nr:hypothetical protein [Moraxellaceae bacterium]